MPELPEVETTRRGIAPHLAGKKIKTVDIRDSRLRWPVPGNLKQLIEKKTVSHIDRRGKYLLLTFSNGCLLIHLGMSGSLRFTPQAEPLLKHDHVVFNLNASLSLRFNDPRRFGSILWTESDPLEHKLLSKLGPEPFSEEFTGDYLFKQSRGRKIAVKNFIMDSHIVVGVGNIYANETLFLSGIRPRTAAQRIRKAQYQQLSENIKIVLAKAIAMGGTTLKDFVGSDGKPGYFQQTLNVYDRKDQPCTSCTTAIKHLVLGQRSTYYCPNCQQ